MVQQQHRQATDAMKVDLFLKKVPQVVKELIGREASANRRSINQEAIALLEEALLLRVKLAAQRRPSAHEVLESYASEDRRPAVVDSSLVNLTDRPADVTH
jgi:hypothetical protein